MSFFGIGILTFPSCVYVFFMVMRDGFAFEIINKCVFKWNRHIHINFFLLQIFELLITQVYKKNDQNAINIAPMYSYVFGVAEFESEVRIGPSGHNFFLTSKTCFTSFIFFQAQFCFESSEKNHSSVLNYHRRP